MTLLESFVSAAAPDLPAQIADAKQTAQQAAGVISAWGFLIAVELAVLIYLAARGKRG